MSIEFHVDASVPCTCKASVPTTELLETLPPDNMFLLRFEEGAAIRIQSLMPRSNAMHLFRPTDSFPSGATHTTLASASASALLLVAPTGNADANSMLEAYAPIDERLRSWEASHRIHTGRMRKSTSAAVNCGARACSTPVWYHTAQVQECSAGASRPAPQSLTVRTARLWPSAALAVHVSEGGVTR